MKTSYHSGFTVGFLLMVSFATVNVPVLAQIRGQDSQQFFDRGNQIIERQIQEIQRENVQESQQPTIVKEGELSNELEEKKDNNISVEENPDIDNNIIENVSPSPVDEIDIQEN